MNAPFYHTYIANRFAEENAFGARHCQPWPWAHYNATHPDPAATDTLRLGHRPERWPTFADARPRLPAPHWEHYTPDFAGVGRSTPDFVGWTGPTSRGEDQRSPAGQCRNTLES